MRTVSPPRTGIAGTPGRVVVLIVIVLLTVVLTLTGQDAQAAAGIAVVVGGAGAEIAGRLLGAPQPCRTRIR